MQIYEQYLELSNAVYGTSSFDTNTWEQLSVNVTFSDNSTLQTINGYYSTSSGMQAAAYQNKNTGEIVIAYRGTDELQDYKDDVMIAAGLAPSDQFADADKFYQAVQAQYGSNITITGHSLGGGLAEMIGSKYGNNTYTYNAPGLNAYAGSYTNQITNFVVMDDWCGMLRAHAGTTYYIEPIPIINDPLIDTHMAILNYNETDYGPILSKPIGFGTKEGLALWYYDINNNSNDDTAQAIKAAVGAQVNETDLQNAINIINTVIGTPIHSLYYSTPDGDYILDNDGSHALAGSDGNDKIWGNEGNDNITGGTGNDEIYSGANNDTIYGNITTVTTGDGKNNLYGEAGNDYIIAGDNNDYIDGGADNDILVAGIGNDMLIGGTGDDELYSGTGKSMLIGGNGNDTYHVNMLNGLSGNDFSGKTYNFIRLVERKAA